MRPIAIASILIAAGLLMLPGLAHAKLEFYPQVEANLALSSAKFDAEYAAARSNSGQAVSSNQESTGQDLWLFTAGNFRLTELPGLIVSPTLQLDYSGANNLLQIDDEAFIWAKHLDFYYTLGASYKFSPVWSAKIKGFGRINNSQETNDENIYNGLYNFRDAGAWTEGAANYRLFIPMRAKLGIKGYTRRYPNYSNHDLYQAWEEKKKNDPTIGDWPASVPKDLHEKDVNVNEYWLRNEATWGSWPVLTNLELHWKLLNYTEMPAILADGSFSQDLRRDINAKVVLEIPFMINPYNQFELDYVYELNGSNQGLYDSAQKFYLGGYYNYYANRLNLIYNFGLPFKLTGFNPKGSLQLSNQRKQYIGRPARQKAYDGDVAGQYNFNETHWENTLDLGLTMRQTLFAKWFSLVLSLHFITLSSNTNVEDNASYNYKYNTFTLGTALSF